MSITCWESGISVEPDQMPHSKASDLGVHSLLRYLSNQGLHSLICPSTKGKIFSRNHIEIFSQETAFDIACKLSPIDCQSCFFLEFFFFFFLRK